MSNVRNEKLVRPRRPVLSAPKPRILGPGGEGGGEGGERRSDPARPSDEWVEQSAQGPILSEVAYVAPDRDPIDMRLDALLAMWHDHVDTYRFERKVRAPSMADSYQTPKHHDFRHGIIDEVTDKATAQAVGACIAALEQPWQAAIVIVARNIATGNEVWVSPRLPADKAEREVIVLEARNMLLMELRRAHVME